MSEGEGNKEKPKFIPKEDFVKSRRSRYSNDVFGISEYDVPRYKELYGGKAKGKQRENMSDQEKELNFQGEKASHDTSEFKNWLVSEEDLKSITDDTLKTFIEFTGGIDPEHLTASFILNSIDRLQDLVLNGKIAKTEADKLIPKIHMQLRELTERDRKRIMESSEKNIPQGEKIRKESEFSGEEKQKPTDIPPDVAEAIRIANRIQELQARKKFDRGELEEGLSEQDQSELHDLYARLGRMPNYLQGLPSEYRPIFELPDPKKDPEKFIGSFRERLYALHEEYPDQSFDTNWQLIYPLQKALNDLWPEDPTKDVIKVFYDMKDKDGNVLKDPLGNVRREEKVYSMTEMRKELTLEFEAHRNFHNFIYLYKRVSGVAGVVEASSLLYTNQIEVLLHKKEIADALKKFEIMGEEYKRLNELIFSRTIEKETDAEEKITRGYDKQRQDLLQEMISLEQRDWSHMLAGGLYSALHEAQRHNVVLKTGDFFVGRCFNIPDHAKTLWEKNDRKDMPFPKFYKALDLKLTGFWETVLKDKVDKLYDVGDGLRRDEIKNLLANEYGIIADLKETRPKKGKPYLEIESFSLKKVDFQKIYLHKEEGKSYFEPSSREVITRLDVEVLDADAVRKLILKPGNLVEQPNFNILRDIYKEFQHLKGKDRSKWYRDVLEQVIFLYRDETVPAFEEWPMAWRRCPAKRIIKEHVDAMTDEEIIRTVGALTPPLTLKHAEQLLTNIVGDKFQRALKKAGNVGFSMGGAFLRGIAESFLGFKK